MNEERTTPRERRRLAWTIGLALLLGLAGAWVGWQLTVPTYRSTGLIHISPTVITPRDPEAKSVTPMIEAAIESQVAHLRSRRVILKAMDSPPWNKVESGIDVAEFKKRLEIVPMDHSLRIPVSFTDPTPKIAAAGVKAVIRAYVALAPKLNGDTGERSLKSLGVRMDGLAKKLEEIDTELQEILSPYGGQDGLETRFQAFLGEVARQEASLRDLDIQLENARAAEDLAAVARLTAQRSRIVEMLKELKVEIGRLAEVRDAVEQLLRDRAIVTQQFSNYRAALEQVEAEAKGRISVISDGDLPVSPHKDHRILWAVGLGVAGLGLGVLLVFLPGILHRRRKDPADRPPGQDSTGTCD